MILRGDREEKSVHSAGSGRDQENFARESDTIIKCPHVTEVMNVERRQGTDIIRPKALWICINMYNKISLLLEVFTSA